jgi:acyl-CoA thioesterase
MSDGNDATPTDSPLGIIHYEGTFLEFLGFSPIEIRDGFARLEMPVRPDHRNTVGMLHGGVAMAMLDIAGAVSAHGGRSGENVSITVNQFTSFQRAHRGDRLIAEGTMLRRSGSLAFTEARILDPSLGETRDAQTCSTAQCTYKIKRRTEFQTAPATGDDHAG